MQAYQSLEKTFQRLSRFNHLASIVGWDEAVMMPAGGGEARSRAMAELRVYCHELLAAPQMGEWIQMAKAEKLNDWQQANLHEIERTWKITNSIDGKLVEKLSLACMKSEQQWRVLRKQNNWKDFLPFLKEVVQLSKEEANQLGQSLGYSPYNALMQKYEPGMTAEKVEPVFAGLKKQLPELIQQIIEKQQKKNAIKPQGEYPVEAQKQLGLQIMKAVGFDFNHGRLDVSHHPFCGGVPEDVRMTTRYTTDDFFGSLMGVIHETGHACYEQGLPKEWNEQAVGSARGMGIHESQSLFFEMQMSRSVAFLKWIAPLVKKAFANAKDVEELWTSENLFLLSTTVRPGYIRVDADEVTYPLHIILRFEIERALMDGQMQVEDLPSIWNEKMQKYLGLSTLGKDHDGCMQDVHWPAGSFGYFPSYTLGAMTAAQLSSKMKQDIPNRDSQWEKGEFASTGNWLREKIWSRASKLPTDELLKAATGETLNADYFIAHVKQRYL